jgi:UDP-glucuronate 4-epimerase
VSDIVAGIVAALHVDLPFATYNLGNSAPVELRTFVEQLAAITGLPAVIESQPLPAADPPKTYADITRAQRELGFQPQTPLTEGLTQFWEWYRGEYGR